MLLERCHMLVHFTQLFPPVSSYCSVSGQRAAPGQVSGRGFILQINQSDNHFSNNNCVIIVEVFFFLKGLIVSDDEFRRFVLLPLQQEGIERNFRPVGV